MSQGGAPPKTVPTRIRESCVRVSFFKIGTLKQAVFNGCLVKQSFCKKRFGIIQLKHTLEIWLFRVPDAIYLYIYICIYIYIHTHLQARRSCLPSIKRRDPHPLKKDILDAKIYMTLQYPKLWSWFFSDIFLEQFHSILPWVKYCRPLRMVNLWNIHTELWMHFLYVWFHEIF